MTKALSLLIDRTSIIENALPAQFAPAYSPIVNDSLKSKNLIKHDKKLAKKLLNELGYKHTNNDGILYRINDNKKQKAKFTIVYSNPSYGDWFDDIIKNAKEIGLDLKALYLPFSQLNILLDKKEFEGTALKFSTYFSYDSFISSWHSKGITNFTGFSDKKVDSFLDKFLLNKALKNTKEFNQNLEKIKNSYLWIYLFKRKTHNIAYWKDKLNAGSNHSFSYSGDDIHNIFYLHWKMID